MDRQRNMVATDARDSLVIIPTYKEEENIAAIIDAVMALNTPMDVLVIDDS